MVFQGAGVFGVSGFFYSLPAHEPFVHMHRAFAKGKNLGSVGKHMS